MKKIIPFFLILLVSFALTACMYPEDELAQNKIPYEDQIKAVQSAVNQFREANNGILPIKTKEADTPIYQKYPIDFKKISPKFMAEPPGNAFESGGIFQYVLIDVETNPTVKLLDVRMAETIRDIKIRIQTQGYPPFKEKITNNVFTLDYKKLGFKEEPFVVSPITQKNLPLVIDGNAEIYVDYRSDLYELLQKNEHSYKPGDDIRELLTKNSYFVPAYSLPYTIDENSKDPIFLEP
ncbi:hypothetical protein HHO41_08395 [Bacillus sp. DNRA2]|uniref:hypothetical protein n=1 Tax=Bacillus sp. DNRA2 TaxID=2723053 RepID=UPI00145EFC89|nr:hypothetical protein [Bacillus sp. DNRA2]NMD70311.1 hypothetical protein [Bacillus sp. DNRA2]